MSGEPYNREELARCHQGRQAEKFNPCACRAPKSQQLSKDPHFEIAWWFAPSGDQFRITGRAYVVGPPDHSYTKTFLSEHGKRLAPPGLNEEFNWEDERRRIYEKISPPIRASFARPIPGTPLKQSERKNGSAGKEEEGDYEPKDWPEELKMDGDEKLLKLSYSNFALTWVPNFAQCIPIFKEVLLRLEVPTVYLNRWKLTGAS